MSLSYDNEGNSLTKTRVSDGQLTSFQWDTRNRLTEVEFTLAGNLVFEERYTYDAFDRRIGVWTDADGAGAGVQLWTAYEGGNAWADWDSAVPGAGIVRAKSRGVIR